MHQRQEMEPIVFVGMAIFILFLALCWFINWINSEPLRPSHPSHNYHHNQWQNESYSSPSYARVVQGNNRHRHYRQEAEPQSPSHYGSDYGYSSTEHPGIDRVKYDHRAIYIENNRNRPRNEIDLHLLHCDEAVAVVSECIRVMKGEGHRSINIITGKGTHSADGVARLRNAVQEHLAGRGMRYKMQNPGMISVPF